ncbi:TPA: hypothetical protein ACIJ25_006404 [Pseudomonas aeruginosa]
MKKLLFAFLISTSLLGCSGDSVDKSADKLREKSLNQVMFLNAMESVFGCETTQDAVDLVQFNKTNKATYECQLDNNTFVATHEVISKTDGTLQYLFKGFISALIVIGLIVAIKHRSTGTKFLSYNNTGKFLSLVINVFLRYKIRFIWAILIFAGWMIATSLLEELDDEKLYKEKSVEIPHFSVKTVFAKSIYDYQLCVKSSDFNTSNEDPSIRIIKSNNAYKIEAQYRYCELNGGFQIDKEGIEVAKANGLLDFEAFQEQSIVANLKRLFEQTDLVAQRTIIAEPTYDVVRIPQILTCENTPTSYSGLSDEEKSEVVWKDLECASRAFVVATNKFSGMTEERMDTLQTLTGGRRVLLCEGELSNQPFTNREGMKERYKACVSRNCTDGGSIYSCGVALSKFNIANQEKMIDFLSLSTFSVFESEPEIRSAKMFNGTLNAQFVFEENPSPYTVNRKTLATFTVSKIQNSKMSYQAVGNFLNKVDLITLKNAAINFSPMDFISRQLDPGNGGVYGTKRYLSCFTNPFSLFDNKYDCGSLFSESTLVGNVMYVGAGQLTLLNSFLKPKTGRKKLDKTDTSYTTAKEGLKLAGIDRKKAALLLPFLFDEAGGMVFEDVYQENYNQVMGQKGEYFAAMTCITISKACADVVETVADGLYIGYVIFSWVIPLTPLLTFLGLLAAYFAPALFTPITIVIRYIVKYGKNENREDLDKHVMVTQGENLLLKPFAMVVGFIISQLIFYIIAIFFIQDITEYTSEVIDLTSEAGMAGDFLNTIYSMCFVYFFYIISVFLWISYIASVERSDGVVTSSDGKIQNASEMRRYGKAMKFKGLD